MRKVLYLAMVLSFVFTSVWAQDKTISGKVTSSDDGSSLPGVSVLLKGTNTGTVTDIEGVYKLTVPSDGGVLVFSFIGMKSQEVTIGSQSVIDLAMAADVTQLSEVVVTALNIPREKKTLGYATQEVKAENLRVARDMDLNTALAGKISGVQVVGGSGAKFGQSGVRIRGVRGLNAQPPLYVLDGIILEDATAINMDNVASVNVLKGASAAALYGNRARDGVIIVTSKKGTAGQLTIDFHNTTQFENVVNLPEYQDEYGGGYSQDFRTFVYDPAVHPVGLASLDGALYPNPMAADESWGAPMNGQQVAQWDAWTPGTEGYGQTRAWEAHPDNIKNFFETGVWVNNNLSVGKGGDGYNVMASFTDSRRSGIIPGSSQDRNFLNLNASIDLSPKITLLAASNYSSTKTEGNLTEGYQGSLSQNFNQWWQRQLDMDLLEKYWKMPDGRYTSWNLKGPTNATPQYWDNPYTQAYANIQLRKSEDLSVKLGLQYEIIDGLQLAGNLYRTTRNNWFEGRTASGTLDVADFTTSSQSQREDNMELILSYNKQWTDWSLSALVGGNQRRNESYYWYESTVGGLSVPDLYNLKASVDRPDARNSKSFKEVNSIFAQASLGWQETVFLDATIRNDWSSTLPEDNNSYLYPSASLSFIWSEMLSNQSVLSFGKVRLSYAQVGSDIGAYQLDPTFTVGTPYGNTPTMSLPNTLPNGNLRPALSNSLEAGLEFKFLQNRIYADFAIYKYENKDEIIQVSTPSTSGYSAAWINAGLTTTNGYEFTIGGYPVQNANFQWDISFNASRFRNQVEELYGDLTNVPLNNGWLGTGTTGGWGGISANARVGEEWGTLYGQAFERNANGTVVVDANGYPKTVNDQNLGTILPDYVGGIFNRFTYKNFDLAFTIDWQAGGKFHSVTKMFNAAAGLSAETAGNNDKGNPQRDDPASGGGIKFPDAVKEDGTPNDIYVDANSYWWGLFALHERWIYDASYVKLREVRLGYTFNPSMLGNTVRALSVAFVANNPWLIYNTASGIDPSQISGDAVNARTNGAWAETGQLPGTRTLGFDIKVGF